MQAKLYSLVGAGFCLYLSSLQAMPALQGNEQLWLLSSNQQLSKVNVSQPDIILEQYTLVGLKPDEQLIGIDYRVAYGVLFGLSNHGQLYRIDTKNGELTKVGESLSPDTLQQGQYGFDFNPAADRIRVVNEHGQNIRLHPETGSLAATDPVLHYAPDDVNAAVQPKVVAAAYTYNQKNEKLTTNYAIDLATGSLVTQGSVEEIEPAISPNTGTLFTVGKLGLSGIDQLSFDISDVRNIGLLSVQYSDVQGSFLYQIDLASGKTQRLGSLGKDQRITGLAIEP